jgi:hypothetical protein
MMNTKSLEASMTRARKADFDNWMGQPATRFLMSMIPEGERQEALQTLLQGAFEAGFASGSATVAVSFVSELMKHRPD